MRTTSGYILIEKSGSVSSCRRYTCKVDRDMIIKKWIKLYRLEGKSYTLIIQPDVNISDLLNLENDDGDKKILPKRRRKK